MTSGRALAFAITASEGPTVDEDHTRLEEQPATRNAGSAAGGLDDVATAAGQNPSRWRLGHDNANLVASTGRAPDAGPGSDQAAVAEKWRIHEGCPSDAERR